MSQLAHQSVIACLICNVLNVSKNSLSILRGQECFNWLILPIGCLSVGAVVSCYLNGEVANEALKLALGTGVKCLYGATAVTRWLQGSAADPKDAGSIPDAVVTFQWR